MLYGSGSMREISAESDALHLGMGWSFDELSAPNVIIESTFGESHPGSSHLLRLSDHAREGVLAAGGKPATFVTTDICDGVAQGGDSMQFSLLSREFIAGMVEIHVRASLCDGLVMISSCDKSVPAHILAAARLHYPCIFVPGGCMSAGAGFLTVDRLWEMRNRCEKGETKPERLVHCQANSCPSEGACQPMGTAGTMQIMAESLGLALPGTAVTPAVNNAIARNAREAGRQILRLIQKGITGRDILTTEAFENAICVHAAVGGSSNAILHIIAAAKEAGADIDIDTFERINRNTPYLVNVMNTGKYPTELFWYAGGVPAVMNEIRDLLHLDVMTVSGLTLGENLDAFMASGRLEAQNDYLNNYSVAPADIIRRRSDPVGSDGGLAVLKGNIAPDGAVVKHSAVDAGMHHFVGRVRAFDDENKVLDAFKNGRIRKGDVIVISCQGPRACGMPEMFRTSDAINNYPVEGVAVITDGRYSGCTSGPAIGYISPEAVCGGPIGLLKDGDTIEIDIRNRSINFVAAGNDVDGGSEILKERALRQIHQEVKPERGVRGIYQRLAASAAQGAGMTRQI